MAYRRRVEKARARSRKVERELTLKLSKAREVLVFDDSRFEPGRCNNGGQYRFVERFTQRQPGCWELSFQTTAEFDFCPFCGEFGDHLVHDEGEDEWYHQCGPFDTFSTQELARKLRWVESNTEAAWNGDGPAYWYSVDGTMGGMKYDTQTFLLYEGFAELNEAIFDDRSLPPILEWNQEIQRWEG
jgi:hypothetical protein